MKGSTSAALLGRRGHARYAKDNPGTPPWHKIPKYEASGEGGAEENGLFIWNGSERVTTR